MYRATKAIVMAAGLGSRLMPLTAATPKPLIPVKGVPMIERLIEQLNQQGIEEIIVVTGHLHEQFNYLAGRVTLIYNPHYATCNNISSLYLAREYLGECIIIDGDIVVNNPTILNPNFDQSAYCSVHINEWVQQVDKHGQVVSTLRGSGYQLYSISFWTRQDGLQLQQHLEELFLQNKDVFWDDIPHFIKPEAYQLGIRKIQATDITEIDTLEELRAYETTHGVR